MSHIIHNLVQGSAEWHAHRTSHFNASEAAAMLGLDPNCTRTELLRLKSTGNEREFSAWVQRNILDKGHEFEALARPWAEELIGEDLYPITASRKVEGLALSASYDGATMMETLTWEHKRLNAALSAGLVEGLIPEQYHPQLEQQLLIIGAERALFMASSGDKDNALHVWYESRPALRARLIAGWKQFALDLANYVPRIEAPVITPAPVEALPALTVQFSGAISIADNFPVFEKAIRDFLESRLIREPKTDQDFADLDVQIKAMKGAEAALETVEAQMTVKMQTVEQAKATRDMLAKLVRENRIMAERLLTTEKERRRGEIVAGGVEALHLHIQGLNARLGKRYMPAVEADFEAVAKFKRTTESVQNAVDTLLANTKIKADAVAADIEVNLATLAKLGAGYEGLFADEAVLVMKAPGDFCAVVAERITAHQAHEAQRLQAEQARIRAEELARIEREQEEAAAQAEKVQKEALAQTSLALPAIETVAELEPEPVTFWDVAIAGDIVDAEVIPEQACTPVASAVVVPLVALRSAEASTPTLRLGQINARLAPIQINADGLRQLGFEPAGKDRAAVLYHEADFLLIRAALIKHLNQVHTQLVA